MKHNTQHTVMGAAFVCATTLILLANDSCTSKAASTASDVLVRVADDACHELVDAGVAPEWVQLVCDTAAGPVRVLLPRAEWHSILARKAGTVDAGPGK